MKLYQRSIGKLWPNVILNACCMPHTLAQTHTRYLYSVRLLNVQAFYYMINCDPNFDISLIATSCSLHIFQSLSHCEQWAKFESRIYLEILLCTHIYSKPHHARQISICWSSISISRMFSSLACSKSLSLSLSPLFKLGTVKYITHTFAQKKVFCRIDVGPRACTTQ